MKTPFYMTYPLQTIYETELEYEKDMERMKENYPLSVKNLLAAVEERCDELEYEGSRMYDENPDRVMMNQEIEQICDRIHKDKMEKEDGQEVYDIVFVLFYNELYRRRCRYRRCHKWW